MHWLSSNWALVLGWALYIASDSMPFLSGKAQGVVHAFIEIGKAVLAKKAPEAPKAP